MENDPVGGADVHDACLLTPADLQRRWQVGRTKAWEVTRRADFPVPVVLGGSCVRWRLGDVAAWEASHTGPPPERAPRRRPGPKRRDSTPAQQVPERSVTPGSPSLPAPKRRRPRSADG